MKSIWEKSEFIRGYLWIYRKYVAIGIAALVAVDILEIIPPLIIKAAVDKLSAGTSNSEILDLAFLYFGISILQSGCRYLWRIYIVRTSMWAGRDIRDRFAAHLFSLSQTFFDRTRVGDLMSHATNDTEAIRRAMGPGLIVFADAVFYVLTVPIAMFYLSPKLTLLAFIPMPLIPLVVLRNEKEIHRRFDQVQASFSHLSSMAQENLMGIRVVKSFAREHAQLARFANAGVSFVKLNMKLARTQSAFGPIMDFIMSTGMVMLLYFGGKWAIADSISIGTFVAFQRYIQKMIWPMEAIGLSIVFFQRGAASSERVIKILEQKSDLPEASHSTDKRDIIPSGPLSVEFKNCSFSYPGSKTPCLKNINFKIEPGMKASFIGPIGSGKSTLLNLIPKIYPLERGMLYIGGRDINDWYNEDLRARIGIVPQDIFLFSESVSENITFGISDSDESLPFEMIDEIADRCCVKSDILSLIDGYDTKLGERGVNLSGGQKQRISISRALIKNPAVLILDDSLSAVDVETEARLLVALRQSLGTPPTELISGHRISTVQSADMIYVVNYGEIVDQGTHRQLIRKKGGLYLKFYEQQRLKEELEQYLEDVK